ncbi:MAG: hypothetical protein HOC71_13030 [Candidatus Latescibacteria bacterium]|nr:hypothetical protein [Candidatus Latescibacterota bacterium]
MRFCYYRWIVIFILLIIGISGFIPGIFQIFGFNPHTGWSFITAGILVGTNIVYLIHIRSMKKFDSMKGIMINLWFQIVTDLIVLTVVIHFIGSLETYIPFAYLFHIVLTCIFFPGFQSLVVTIIAAIFYIACVFSESKGIVSPAGIYSDGFLRQYIDNSLIISYINVAFALGIWFVIWYLASHLSALVRERNSLLIQIQEEKTRHMLRTTHELKAPFAAIDANAQILLKGYCGALPDKATKVIYGITARCRRLTNDIQEMLKLANLRSIKRESLQWAELDLANVLTQCLRQIHPIAEERMIQFEKNIKPTRVIAVEDQMQLLFANLLLNAVIYSHRGGRIHIQCNLNSGKAMVTIEDEGIGIQGDKLPKIFNEHYRTNNAVKHNKGSSGLGLTIVGQIAQTHKIRVRVESEPDLGTKFVLRIPVYI